MEINKRILVCPVAPATEIELNINESDVLNRQNKFINGFYSFDYSDNEESESPLHTSTCDLSETRQMTIFDISIPQKE